MEAPGRLQSWEATASCRIDLGPASESPALWISPAIVAVLKCVAGSDGVDHRRWVGFGGLGEATFACQVGTASIGGDQDVLDGEPRLQFAGSRWMVSSSSQEDCEANFTSSSSLVTGRLDGTSNGRFPCPHQFEGKPPIRLSDLKPRRRGEGL